MNNKCKYLRIRHKKGIVYKYCVIKKIQCPLNDNMCYSCNDKEYKEYKPMKKETSKQKKLEENRYSILTNNLNKCYVCKIRKKDDIHEIYAGAKKQTSMKNGFCIPICRRCHNEIQNDEEKMLVYKKRCQQEYEKTHTREEFIKLIKRNYLD